MDQRQILHRAMYGKMAAFFTANAASISSLTDVSALVGDFTSDLTDFDSTAAEAAGTGAGGLGPAKDAAKEAAANNASKWGRRCRIAAHNAGLFALEATINRRAYELIQEKDELALQDMQAIHDGLKMHTTTFTAQGLTGAVLVGMQGLIDAFALQMPAGTDAVDAREGYNKQLDVLEAKLDGELGQIVELLEAEYEDADPVLVSNMMIAYEIGKSTAHRYTGMNGAVRDAQGNAVSGFKVRCAELDKEATTDLLGAYAIQSMKSGLHLYQVVDGTGTVVKHEVLRVRRGQTLVKDWVV